MKKNDILKPVLSCLLAMAGNCISAHDCAVGAVCCDLGKASETEKETHYASGNASAQQAGDAMKEDTVYFNGTAFIVKGTLQSTGHKAADRFISNMLFGKEDDDLQKAYEDFKALWSHKGGNVPNTHAWQYVTLSVKETYKSKGERFACYHVKASLIGRAQLNGLPQNEAGKKMRAQYLRLVTGVDRQFIYDITQQQVADLDLMFVPAVAQQVKNIFGNDVSLYAEDRCLQLLSKKGEGRFIFDHVTEKNFTDYFKQLVGWQSLGDIESPAFLHGQQGLDEYFGKEFDIAADGEEAETATVSLTVREDGTILQPNVETCPANVSKDALLKACEKMPKWMPAFENGQPVAKDITFDIRLKKIDSSTKVFDEVEKMPGFPGGQGALFEYLSKNTRYPAVAEENNIQGRVIVTFVVERDGSITNVKVAKGVDPSLDQEAMRVIRSMPKWIPGKQKGQPIRVKFTVPVTFKLQAPQRRKP